MSLESLFAGLKTLPLIPRVVQEVLIHCGQDSADNSRWTELLAADQALSARLLQVANSARYQMPRQVSSVPQAVQLLGLVNVRTLVISLGLISGFEQLPADQLKPLWRYNLQTAAVARWLAPQVGVDPELAYTLGLLQGIGQLLLALSQPERTPCQAPSEPPQAPHHAAAARLALGYGYTDVSAELARRWQFPALLQQVLAAVAEPLTCGLPEAMARLAGLVQLAACQAWAAGQPPAEPGNSWPAEVALSLGLPLEAKQLAIPPLSLLCPELAELLG